MPIQVLHKDGKETFDLNKECAKYMAYLDKLGFKPSSQSGITSILQDIDEVTVGGVVFRKVGVGI
jgi:hypothetical protein